MANIVLASPIFCFLIASPASLLAFSIVISYLSKHIFKKWIFVKLKVPLKVQLKVKVKVKVRSTQVRL